MFLMAGSSIYTCEAVKDMPLESDESRGHGPKRHGGRSLLRDAVVDTKLAKSSKKKRKEKEKKGRRIRR